MGQCCQIILGYCSQVLRCLQSRSLRTIYLLYRWRVQPTDHCSLYQPYRWTFHESSEQILSRIAIFQRRSKVRTNRGLCHVVPHLTRYRCCPYRKNLAADGFCKNHPSNLGWHAELRSWPNNPWHGELWPCVSTPLAWLGACPKDVSWSPASRPCLRLVHVILTSCASGLQSLEAWCWKCSTARYLLTPSGASCS